ncbi:MULTISPECIES: HAD-IIA family hydrolase [Clostridium]|uniref:Acid sugar phosphatase n=1 Tax=Clostridium butyricum TaxID=1492 RepID=A0A2S7FFT1_CLOBU|nr:MULTISPECIES: HAD-IIA family hydrolase [Clostridium]APF22389.1 nagD protein, putative [Clostridium butyricum]KHD17107.1 HAD family hydrolase [Clostridium butyricum]MBO1686596.1 HAD-IIA family hydrolase [Clostridium butyricum]MBS4839979.1 HAD-IIA family hydrolase [Clostridium sp.]MBZ5744775.1 HAD-IIA family hydrolase [Clostridium butyricum]
MKDLRDIKCFLLDMDGTFYLGNTLIDGALDFLDVLKKQNKEFNFLTNNSSKNKSVYKKKLFDLGCYINEEKIYTSGDATIWYMKKYCKGNRVYVMGTEPLRKEFENSGFLLVKDKKDKPDYVVLGFDTTITYEKIWTACDYLRDGIPFIATHPDFNCPLENNKYMPDTGSMIKMFEASAEVSPLIIGKPSKYIVDAVMEKYGLEKEEVAIVGDRLYTDIKTGENAGITSILVLSGETSEKMYMNSDIHADYVFSSIKDIGEKLKKV